jgi:RHS repeat-associated protein
MGSTSQTTTTYAFLPSRTFTTVRGYDVASNRTTLTDPENGQTTYIYDTLNQLTTLTNFQNQAFTFGYDAIGRRTSLSRPNNVTSTYTYNTVSQLLSVVHKKQNTTLDGATYTVDAANNRTSRTALPGSVTSNFGYDNIYQLLSVTQGSTTAESYTYDPVGNRLSSLGISPYTYNPSNQLTAKPGVTYTYDNNGNMLTKTDGSGTTTYTWDYDNRLSSLTLPGSGGTVTFKYDPFGRRIFKAAAGTTIFVYDGEALLEEVDGSGAVVARYTQGEGIDEPLAMLRTGTTFYYEADGLGSVTSLTNSSGTVSATYTYDTFGNLTASTGSVTNSFRYTGRESDPETGLYYYRARYYDPQVGRFLSEDPAGPSDGLSHYAYVENNPVALTDSSGRVPDVIANMLGRQLSDCVKDILKQYFPNFDLGKIRLHQDKSLHWFGVSGMTRGNYIQYEPDDINGSVQGIALLGHEVMHSVQYAKTGKLSFYSNYALSYVRDRWHGDTHNTAYRKIPVEVEAYKKETEIFQDLFKRYGLTGQPCKDICK